MPTYGPKARENGRNPFTPRYGGVIHGDPARVPAPVGATKMCRGLVKPMDPASPECELEDGHKGPHRLR